MAANRMKIIKNVLEETFSPAEIEVKDESHKHVGHLGAKKR
jgi:BolA-like protein.